MASTELVTLGIARELCEGMSINTDWILGQTDRVSRLLICLEYYLISNILRIYHLYKSVMLNQIFRMTSYITIVCFFITETSGDGRVVNDYFCQLHSDPNNLAYV